MAIAGLFMFGDLIRDEVTANILTMEGHPKWISVFIIMCVAVIPITKVPLKYVSNPFFGQLWIWVTDP